MSYPGREECLGILAEEGISDEVLIHIQVVTELAVEIAECSGADVALVQAAALLHDVGRTRSHGIEHAVEGARILRERGLPSEIVDIVERHIGAGITSEEAGELGLPWKDYMPATLEERIVAHADNLVSGYRRQTIGDHLEGMRKKVLTEQVDRAVKLHRELSEICGRDLDEFCR